MVATAGIAAATWIISSYSPVGANVNPKSMIPCSTSTGSSVFAQLTGISGMPNKHTHTETTLLLTKSVAIAHISRCEATRAKTGHAYSPNALHLCFAARRKCSTASAVSTRQQ